MGRHYKNEVWGIQQSQDTENMLKGTAFCHLLENLVINIGNKFGNKKIIDTEKNRNRCYKNFF